MKEMGQEGHREWAGRGQARLPPSQNSKTPSGTRSHKMQNKKVEVWTWTLWARVD